MCICIVTILIPFTGLIAQRLNLQSRVLVIVEVSVGSGLVPKVVQLVSVYVKGVGKTDDTLVVHSEVVVVNVVHSDNVVTYAEGVAVT